jgi:hypothetical protein
MNKSMLRCVPVLLALFILFFVPSIVLADKDQPELNLVLASLDSKQTKPSAIPTWQFKADSKCMNQCMQEILKCKIASITPESNKKCEKSFDKCAEKCNTNMRSLAKFLNHK